MQQTTRNWNSPYIHLFKRTTFQTRAALAITFLLLAETAPAQKLSAGIVAGGSLTDAFRDETIPTPPQPGLPSFPTGTRYWSPSKDYLAGGMVEIHFNPTWPLAGAATQPRLA